MTDNNTVLEWVIALCEQAVKDKKEGNLALLNRIGGNGALQTFFANAFSIHSVQYNQFHRQFPSQWKEIVGLHEAVLREEAQAEEVQTKQDSIEARLGTLETMLKQFIESQKPVEAKKPGRKPKDPTPPTEPEDGDDKPEGEAPEGE